MTLFPPEVARKPIHVVLGSQGSALICVGGMNFQLPAILDSWFREFGKHVAIWGIPVGSMKAKIQVAASAMRDLPPPCLVHGRSDNSSVTVLEVAGEVYLFAVGISQLVGESTEEWNGRLRQHRERQPEFNITL
jgi:hypothetical protein